MIKKKKTAHKLIPVLALLLLVTASGCGGDDAKGGGKGGPGGGGRNASLSVAVKTQEITKATIEEYSKISCKVEPDNEITVQPKVSGTVENVYVSVGDSVKAGDVLFTVDKSTLQRQVTQANSTYVQAQVNYEAIQNGSLDNELANLKASLKDKQYAYDNALKTYENNKVLYESGAVTKSELDSLEATMEQRKSDMEQAERNLSLYESTTMAGNLRTSEASLAQARANYESAVDSLNDADVKAQIDGVVGEVNVSVGNTVSTQTSAVTIVDMQPVKLSFGVTDRVINQLHIGSAATVTISSVTDVPYSASVTSISPTADAQSGLYTVEAQIDNEDLRIKPGMFAMARLAVDHHEDTIALPLDAVIEENNKSYVYVVDKDLTVHQQTVTTDLRNDEFIEVTGGLSVGDVIVVVGQDFLSDGNTANITEGPLPEGAELPAPDGPAPEGKNDGNGAPNGGGKPPQK